jgi:hypothetical protein
MTHPDSPGAQSRRNLAGRLREHASELDSNPNRQSICARRRNCCCTWRSSRAITRALSRRRSSATVASLTMPIMRRYSRAPFSLQKAILPMALDETAIKESTARAIEISQRIAMIHSFIETIKPDAINNHVPVCMPADVGSLGFDTHIWVGLGIVGLWAALDAFAERAELKKVKCAICEGRCIPARFAGYT